MKVNFSTQSDEELVLSLRRIHRERQPDLYESCIQEMDRRKISGVWTNPVLRLRHPLLMFGIGTPALRALWVGRFLFLSGLLIFILTLSQSSSSSDVSLDALMVQHAIALGSFLLGILILREASTKI